LHELSENVIGDKFKKLADLASKLFKLKDIGDDKSLSKECLLSFDTASHMITKAMNLLQYIVDTQGTYLSSLCKLSYLSQRVFLYILYQGLCGQDDGEEQDQE